MNEWLSQLDPNSLALGGLAGLLLGGFLAWIAVHRAARREQAAWQPRLQQLETDLQAREAALSETKQELAVALTRLEEQAAHYAQEKSNLEQAEKRLTESFERLSGKVFEERSRQFTQLSEQQLNVLLKPLVKDLGEFRRTVDGCEGIPAEKRREVTPHTCRRTFATLAAKNGAGIFAISRLLGHSSVDLTARHYARYAPSDGKPVVDVVARSINGAAPSPTRTAASC